MKFTYKTGAELSAMTEDQREQYATEKRAFEAEANKTAISDALKAFQEANPGISKEEFNDLKESVKQIKENTAGGSQKVTLVSQLKGLLTSIKDIAMGQSTTKEVALKALVLRSAITDNEQAYDLPDIGQLATRKLAMYDVFPKINLGNGNDNGTIRYYDWDEDTIVRAAAAVAEGAAFPESTAKFKKYSITIEKVGDTLPVTEEFFEDEVMFAAELGFFLETNVALEVDRQLADGTGAGNEIKGIKASVDAYTPVAAGIVDANIYDLIVKVTESITATGGAKYSPDVVFMNISDINKMRLKKDANHNYIIPPFVSRDGMQVNGILVIESNNITADTLVLGDRRFARIYEKGGLVMSKGLVGTQFTEDEMTLKVRKRMAFLIRNADKNGWKKVTSIEDALTTLATLPV